MTLRETRRFIGMHHRHNLPPRGWRFGVSVWSVDGPSAMVGVGVASRPVARGLDDGLTMEVTRTCTVEAPNANSMLYGALCRASKALGYHRVVTYTLDTESGASLRAAGFVVDQQLDARPAWEYTAQARMQTDIFGEDRRPPGAKTRWVRWLVSERSSPSSRQAPSTGP